MQKAEPDDEYFKELAEAVKSVQGNVNNVFSTKLNEQVNAKLEEYKKAHPEVHTDKGGKDKDGDNPYMKEIHELKAQLEQDRAERLREKAEREKKDLLASVKKGLEDKFNQLGAKANGFFLKTALNRLEIPEKDADVKSLIEQAEKLYNADVKEAGIPTDTPHAGGRGGGGSDKIDEHAFDDVAKIIGRDRPKSGS